MKNNIIEFVKLGKIPNDNDMTNELFNRYDLLLQNEEPLTYDEAEAIISMFSDDCDDLNWALLHAVESIEFHDVERYKNLIAKCNNMEFREIMKKRFENSLKLSD